MMIYDVYNKRFRGGQICGTLTTHPQDGHSGTFWIVEGRTDMCDNECISKGKCEHNEECYDDVKYEFGCEVTSTKECPLNREIRADERKEFAEEIKNEFEYYYHANVSKRRLRRTLLNILEKELK